MKKIKFGKACAILLAAIASFGITSCSNDSTESEISPAAVLGNIVIGDEILVGSSSGASRHVLSDLQNSSSDFPLYLQSSSRGTICLYFLKYGLSKHPALQTKADFGKVIEWGTFKNDKHSYGSETEKYLENYWAIIKNNIDNFNMGKLSVNETEAGKYEVIQVDPDKAFTHYIILTPTAYGTYDIDFYAVEVMNPGSKADVYYEQTKFTSASNFTVKRFYYEVPEEMKSFDSVKAGISSLTDEGLSSIFDFAGKKMHGLQKFSHGESPVFEKSYTDFVYAAKEETGITTYGIFKNNGTMVFSTEKGYALKFLEGSDEITDDMLNEDANCLKSDYVGEGKPFKCTVNLNTASLDAELNNADNLKSGLLTSASVTGLSDAVTVLNDTHVVFFPAAE